MTKKEKKEEPVEKSEETVAECHNPVWVLEKPPPLIEECCDFLDKVGYDDEGIFRVTGSFKDINHLKEEYGAGKSGLDLSSVSAYSVAGVLTHYFNESAEPIFTFETYDLCIDVMELSPESVREECIRHILSILPPGCYKIIKRFMKVLVECASLSNVNKMTSTNLAIAMSPTLLRPRVETIDTLMAHGDTLVKFVSVLIEKYDILFAKPNDIRLPEQVPETFQMLFEKSKKDIADKIPQELLEKLTNKDSVEIPEEEKPIAKFQALCKGFITRKKLKGVNFGFQASYNRATWEYISRENNFIWTMRKAIRDFETNLGENAAGRKIRKLKALQNKQLSTPQEKNAEAEVKQVIQGFKAIIEVHQMIYEKLLTLWEEQWPRVSNVGVILNQNLQLYIVYNTYITMFCRIESLANRPNANPSLVKWLNFETGYQGLGTQTLRNLLRLPFTHLSGCKRPVRVMMNSLMKYANCCSDEEKKNFISAFAMVMRLATVADSIDERLNYELAVILEQTLLGFDKRLKLATPDRKFILKGPINVNSNASFIFLFDDICLVGKDTNNEYIYNFHIELKEAVLEDTSRTGFLLKVGQKDGETKDYRFNCKEMNQKVQYFVEFQRLIDHLKGANFGTPLDAIIAREGGQIPQLVERLTSHLLSEIQHNDPSFILQGADDEYNVTALKNALNSEDINEISLFKYSSSVIVDVLKLFLLELPRPLLPPDTCTECFKDKNQTEVNLTTLWTVVQNRPRPDQDLLKHIAKFLSETGFDHNNLALVWGHCIYRSTTQSISSCLQLNAVRTIVGAVIGHHEQLSDPTFNPEDFYPSQKTVEPTVEPEPEAVESPQLREKYTGDGPKRPQSRKKARVSVQIKGRESPVFMTDETPLMEF